MSSLLLREVLLDGRRTNIHIDGGTVDGIGRAREADQVIEGKGLAVLPGLVNGHTHAAMTLLRGVAEDMTLQPWLSEKIWPLEARLTPEDVYWGTKLACLEMIKTGTTCFNDMYFFMEETARAVKEMGLRAVLSYGFIDLFDEARAEVEIRRSEELVRRVGRLRSPRIRAALGPHAATSVSSASLEWISRYAEEEGLLIHFHLAETREELETIRKKTGRGIVSYLDHLGFLGPNLVAAHGVHLSPEDAQVLARREVKVVHNPISNMKLASGIFPYHTLRRAGVTVGLGTDGAASNNCLDLFETAKVASLLQKVATGDPTVLPAVEALGLATEGGAKALGLRAGWVKEGYTADLILLDLRRPEMTPTHSVVSNAVFSGGGSSVDTLICDGRVLMRRGKVRGEEEILKRATTAALALVKRRGG